MEEIESVLKTLGIGKRPMDDPFFENSYTCCKVFDRKGVFIEDEEELCHPVIKEFPCNACNANFQNLLDYELHYHDSHHFICTQCKKWRPTSRLLEIHIQETHDNYFKVLAEKQPMYQCFISECNIKFKSAIERREHCKEIHDFPKYYKYDELKQTKTEQLSNIETLMDIDTKESSKKKNLRIYFGKNSKQKTFTKKNFNVIQSVDSNINDLKTETKISPVTQFIPRQVQQKSYAKSLTKNKQMEKNILESESIMELGESLPNP